MRRRSFLGILPGAQNWLLHRRQNSAAKRHYQIAPKSLEQSPCGPAAEAQIRLATFGSLNGYCAGKWPRPP